MTMDLQKDEGRFNEKKLYSFLSSLVQEERAWLLRELLADYWQQGKPDLSEDVLLAERWFMNRIARAVNAAQREARVKFWAIFILFRYGGLRTAEIFSLEKGKFDFDSGVIQINGKFERAVPLPLPVTSRLARYFLAVSLSAARQPFLCDDSQLRKIFRKCASELNIPRATLTVHGLRQLRATELARSGIHPLLIKHFFYGNQKGPSPFCNTEDLLMKQIQKETKMDKLLKTSARNVFRGKIIELKHRGLLVDVTLQTADGLSVTSIITDTSCKSLGLEKGKAVNAIVKAPWVKVISPGQPRENGNEMNYYGATVEDVRKDENAVEILLTLYNGAKLCAVYPQPAAFAGDFKKGANVEVEISAFAVILIEG